MERNLAKRAGITLAAIAISAILFLGGIHSFLPNNIKVFTDEIKTLSLPFKDVTITVLPEVRLIPGGQSVGVTLDVKGVLVVGLEEIKQKDGQLINPGLKAGLQIGDSILDINGIKVDSAAEVREIINRPEGKAKLRVRRGDEIINIEIHPVLSAEDNSYKIGVWVRDKTAGLGTLTFYDPHEKTFGALGHGILDPVTGDLLQVRSGRLLNTRVESVKQGKAGKPGEIRGIFYEAEEPLGELKKNTVQGIFGTLDRDLDNPYNFEPMPIGYQYEIKEGPAYILTTLEGNTIEKFDVNIEKIYNQNRPSTKSMVIKVVDDRLMAKTGGIVQGMSGSPIIQNGKIIGAITHVFVNEPKKGYGIFVEWMVQHL
ncbi:MAG: SpoIVB peptidase [Anaerovoracaceae bacterium]|jgi:stage IV sporulation protein B